MLPPPCEVGPTVIPILEMKTLELEESEAPGLVSGTAKLQSWVSVSRVQALKSLGFRESCGKSERKEPQGEVTLGTNPAIPMGL